MSQLNVSNIQHETGAGSNITLDPSGNVVCAADVQMASQNGGPLAGLRNKLINGDFRIWQKGGGGFTGQGYTADQWFLGSGADVTVNRFDVAGNSGLAYGMQIVSTATVYIQQPIELTVTGKPNPFTPGDTYTLSFEANTGGGTSDVAVRYGFANTGNFSGTPGVTTTPTQTVNNAGGTFSYEVTIPNNCAAANNCFIVGLQATPNADLRIYNIQLERGPIRTTFEYRPISLEQTLCERYYQLLPRLSLSPVTTNATNARAASLSFRTTMRTTPTFTADQEVRVTSVTTSNFNNFGLTVEGQATEVDASSYIRNLQFDAEL